MIARGRHLDQVADAVIEADEDMQNHGVLRVESRDVMVCASILTTCDTSIEEGVAKVLIPC